MIATSRVAQDNTVANVVNGRGVKEEAAAVFGRIREGGAVDADHSAIGQHLGTNPN